MRQCGALGLALEALEALCQTMQAELMQNVEGRVSEHVGSPSVEVRAAAKVGVLENGAGRRLGRLAAIEVVGENRCDAPVVEGVDGQGMGGNGFCPVTIEATKQAQHAEAGSKALFRMGAVGEHSDHQAFAVVGPMVRAQRCRRVGFQLA